MSQAELVAKLAAIGKAHGVAALKESLVEVAFPALELAVQNSGNKIDDIVLAALEPLLKQAILDLLNQL